jgi:hypothetical protein
MLGQMWHFAYAVRYNRVAEWEANARLALHGSSAALPAKPRSVLASTGRVAPHNFRTPAGTVRPRSQRAVMRDFFRKYDGDTESIISAYANAERTGEATRSSDTAGLTPEEYARALLNDGIKKGWL